MSDVIRVIAVIAVIVWVIGRQLRGEPLRGKRVVLLPAVLTVIGIVDVSGNHDIGAADVGFLAVSGIIAVGIGLAQGRVMRLSARGGHLWGQMPVASLWLWAMLIVSRVVVMVIAHGADAKVAASGASILLMLGINRLGQAAVVLPRAMSAGIPFAPEKDGASFLSSLTGTSAGPSSPAAPVAPTMPPAPVAQDGRVVPDGHRADGVDWAGVARQASEYLANRRRYR